MADKNYQGTTGHRLLLIFAGGKKQTCVEIPHAPEPLTRPAREPEPETSAALETMTLRIVGSIPPELWNRLGTRILPKLRSGAELTIGVDFRVSLKTDTAKSVKAELNQALDDLGLSGRVTIEES
ncbi:MAG: hypothetical protein ACLPX5_12865 [Dissulfurispiraceae bacterium]